MSFFIRNKGSGSGVNGTRKRKQQFVAHPSVKKNKKVKNKIRLDPTSNNNEEISSDEDEEFYSKDEFEDVVDEEELETAQEKKLKLAKKYLEEIEREEKERLEADQVEDDVILNRLRDDVLLEAGRLRKLVAEHVKQIINPQDIKVVRCKNHNLAVTCVVISADSRYLFTASKDSSIVKWSFPEMKKLKLIPPKHKDKCNNNLHSSCILSLAVSHDNSYLASGDEGNIIRIWNGDTLEFLFTFTGHRQQVTGLAFCRYTNNLYSCSSDRTIRVWSINDRAFIETLFGHQAPITAVDVISKDKVVTSGGIDNTIRVWKIQDESQLIYNGKSRHIDCVKKINDTHFVSCGEDGSVSLWGIARKKPLHTIYSAHGTDPFSAEANWITCIGTLINTEIFATGSCDGAVRLWKCGDSFKSAELHLEIPCKGFVNAIAFSPDEKYVVFGVGQEHRLGRWSRIKEAKNSVVIVSIAKDNV